MSCYAGCSLFVVSVLLLFFTLAIFVIFIYLYTFHMSELDEKAPTEQQSEFCLKTRSNSNSNRPNSDRVTFEEFRKDHRSARIYKRMYAYPIRWLSCDCVSLSETVFRFVQL